LPGDRIEAALLEGIVQFTIDVEKEEDGRWIAEVPELPGTLAYGASEAEAKAKVQALALRVVADRLEHGEAGAEFSSITFNAA
jgi:predicted RNase H-like HicB family nuclease